MLTACNFGIKDIFRMSCCASLRHYMAGLWRYRIFVDMREDKVYCDFVVSGNNRSPMLVNLLASISSFSIHFDSEL